jgi:hypothetical protein
MGTPPEAAIAAVEPVAVLIHMPLDHTLKLKISSPVPLWKPSRNLLKKVVISVGKLLQVLTKPEELLLRYKS